MGIIAATYFCEMQVPQYIFGFCVVFYVVFAVQNLFLSDELESDEYASTKDIAYLEYEAK